jgi:hypothetical protein
MLVRMPSTHLRDSFYIIKRKYSLDRIRILLPLNTSIKTLDSIRDFVFLKILHLSIVQPKRNLNLMIKIEWKDKDQFR